MYIGADEVLLALDVQFDPDSTADDIAAAIASIEREIRERYPKIKRIYIEASELAIPARPK
jgi:divalent metal cation (Fe/Co/Zn/Cd) transporter